MKLKKGDLARVSNKGADDYWGLVVVLAPKKNECEPAVWVYSPKQKIKTWDYCSNLIGADDYNEVQER